MDCEIITSSRSSQTIAPYRSIRVLVVDNDSTSLTIAAAALESYKYKVLTKKDAFDALCTLRMEVGSIDLVLTEVHMPALNGFELQKQIQEEFKLPVVFLSADDKDAIAQKGVQSGAALFIVKPITPSHLEILWQLAVASRKGKTVTEESGSAQEAHQIAKGGNQAIRFQETNKFSIQEMEHASSPIEYMPSMKGSGKKAIVMDIKAEEGDGSDSFAGPRKPRFSWKNYHSQFVEAVKALDGPKKALPKELVNLMKVPGLTREQVANHLQSLE